MKIWKMDFAVNDYDIITTIPEMSLEEDRSYNGASKIAGWIPLKVRRVEPEKHFPLGNVPGYSSHIPVFDEKALEILGNLLRGSAEVLPLAFDEVPLYFINVTDVIDAIDYEKSKYKTFSDGKRIMRFIKYVFIEAKVAGKHIFKLIDEPLGWIFVSNEFKETAEAAGLEGFDFQLLWDSEVEN